MKLRIAIGAIILGMAFPSFADPIVWEGNGHGYEVITGSETLSWDEARALAEGLGGHLVTITDTDENDFVAGLVSSLGSGDLQRYWLGGYQTDPSAEACEPANCWAWITGEEWAFDNWEVGEPNNGVGGTQHYLHYWRTPGVWDDMENRAVMDSFVVEYTAIPEPGTMALIGIGLLAMGLTRRKRLVRVA